MSEAPDKNCITLPDGSCIGTGCMHDPVDQQGARERWHKVVGEDVDGTPIYAIWGYGNAIGNVRAETYADEIINAHNAAHDRPASTVLEAVRGIWVCQTGDHELAIPYSLPCPICGKKPAQHKETP